MDPVRILCLLGASTLAATKIWAGLTGDLAATMAAAGADPWGVVALIALYAGLAAALLVMLRLEPDRRIALLVIVATPLVGNMAPALWLAFRGLDLIRSRRAG
ncbi:MAG: hypothetical protein NTZ14_02825 [Hyphomicrobiales bacterium]|jgi:hypothetical protein|nr:hypothetical protein [Hyphomicrobiales bacterium]